MTDQLIPESAQNTPDSPGRQPDAPETPRTAVERLRDQLAVRGRELEQLRTDLADEQSAYRSRTEQWKRVVHSRQHAEEQRDQLAAALTEVLAVPRIPDSGGDTAVHIGPVKCTWVERWRGVLKAASNGSDTGPSVDEVKADDARWWNGEKEGA